VNIAVIGTGYVGLSAGLGLSLLGHNVFCIDKDLEKIENLLKNNLPFYEPNLKIKLKEQLLKNKINFSQDLNRALENCSIIILALPTPVFPDGSMDFSCLYSCIDEISRYNFQKDINIIIKSTVTPGTTHLLKEYSEKKDLKATFIYNPEFLREGSALHDFLYPERIVVGIHENQGLSLAKKIYSSEKFPNSELIITDYNSAELSKCLSNSFLAVKISFINEAANLCKAANADIKAIQKILGKDSRIGSQFLKSGIGYGGSCLPKDVRAILDYSKKISCNLGVISAAHAANEQQLNIFLNLILNYFNNNTQLTVWGASFKPETSDIRESVSVKIIKKLLDKNFKIVLYDPKAIKNVKKEINFNKNLLYSNDILNSLNNSDGLIINTEWQEFCEIDPEEIKKHLKGRVIFDGRNCLNKTNFLKSDFKYYNV